MRTAPRTDHLGLVLRLVGLLALAFGVLAVSPLGSQTTAVSDAASLAMPEYDDEGNLLLPAEYKDWVFVGASLGLSYSEGSGGMEMFHETLMEPTALAHFAATGEFREGTMLALLLHGTEESVLPQRRGRFAGPVAAVELAVKDSSASERGWEYYGFADANGIRDRAGRMRGDSCYECHETEAAHDNVFIQFYPLLAERAPAGTVFRSGAGDTLERAASRTSERESTTSAAVALAGLDPVLLADGSEELGKPEIVMEHGEFTYQFVSEPTRARFEADPARYAFHNETCPVVPGASIDPSLFVIHAGRIYGFASSACVEQFKADPTRYLEEPAETTG